MSADDRELLHRHLNGDLDAGEQAEFVARLQASPELRRELASLALDEMLISELVLEKRTVAPARRRTWLPAAVAAALLLGLVAMLVRPSRPAVPADPRRSAEVPRRTERPEVAEAVRRACAFLESHQADLVLPIVSEQRHSAPPRRTYAELALLALHRAGVPDTHPLKAELLGSVTGRSIESTYAAALQAMALSEIDPAAHQGRIRYCAQLLVDSQCANGQWDYAVKTLPEVPATGRIRRRREGPAGGDNSVSSYAVLGLLAATRAGVDLDPDVVERARRWWLKAQNPDGGWGYNDINTPAPGEAGKEALTSDTSYGSMTAAGVASLAALREIRSDEGKSDAAIGKGVAWLGANFAADHTPRKAPGFLPLHWLTMAGRAGTLLSLDRFGAHDWFAEGTDFLLKTQRPGGEWVAERGEFMKSEKMDVLDTCLAILFLRGGAR